MPRRKTLMLPHSASWAVSPGGRQRQRRNVQRWRGKPPMLAGGRRERVRVLMGLPKSAFAFAAPQTPKKAVLYVRVSSKEQREEGYSIEAQLRLLQDYAGKQGFVIAEQFTDVESASKSGRTGFNAMLAFLKRQPSCRAILVEKT